MHSSSGLGKIPFGLRSADQQYVDVQDCPRGLASGCVCPSCGLPLVAKQGTVNQWHFAHHSRKSSGTTDQVCEYSFYVSVAHRVREYFKTEGPFPLQLPDYVLRVTLYDPILGNQAGEAQVTEGQRITLDSVEVDVHINGQRIDVDAKVKQTHLLLVLDYPGRALKTDPAALPGRAGVLIIDLAETHNLFWQKESNSRFSDHLHHWVFNTTSGKRWMYHPRQEKVEVEAKEQLRRWAEDLQKARRRDPLFKHQQLSPPLLGGNANEPKDFLCRLCNVRYSGTVVGLNPCTQCHSHMYRISIDD